EYYCLLYYSITYIF
nr:immunoglobulin light chain junction region [Macaca mulatta]